MAVAGSNLSSDLVETKGCTGIRTTMVYFYQGPRQNVRSKSASDLHPRAAHPDRSALATTRHGMPQNAWQMEKTPLALPPPLRKSLLRLNPSAGCWPCTEHPWHPSFPSRPARARPTAGLLLSTRDHPTPTRGSCLDACLAHLTHAVVELLLVSAVSLDLTCQKGFS